MGVAWEKSKKYEGSWNVWWTNNSLQKAWCGKKQELNLERKENLNDERVFVCHTKTWDFYAEGDGESMKNFNNHFWDFRRLFWSSG